MRRISFFLLVLSIGFGVAAPGKADERLAMPFECGLEGGEVRLVPASEVVYPIAGTRDEQAITVCNPADSMGCRTIMVHRFDISCGTSKVSWMQVAAAVQRSGGKRTWIEDGHLNVMLPSRGAAPPAADCLSRTADAANGLERRVVLKQDCLPWSRRSQIDHVVLPAGYAPIGELGAHLVFDGDEASGIQLAKADPDAVWEPNTVIEPQLENVESAAAGSTWVTVVRTESDRSLRPGNGSGGMAWEWTWLLSAMGLATAAIVARMRYPQALPIRLKSFRSTRKRLGLADPSHAGQVVSALLERTEGVLDGLKGAGALREVLQSELDRVHRTLANVEAANADAGAHDGEREAKTASLYRALVRDLERIGRIAESAASSFSGGQRSVELPRTKSEAYDVLGVNADVSEAVLKKIADALRMSWHPDHARDDDDRREREQRIRQINAAWELIADKPAMV